MSSSTVALDIKRFHDLSQSSEPNSLSLQELAKQADTLAEAVEFQWDEFSPQEREFLEKLVYDALHSNTSIWSWLSSIPTRLLLLSMLLRDLLEVVRLWLSRESLQDIKLRSQAFSSYQAASQRLIDAVLDAVERSHPEYDRKMEEVLQDVFEEADDRPGMTVDEFKEWLDCV
mgnify:CR=1 FL=1